MKPDVIIKSLEKLYAKRKILDKQIEDAQKKLISAAKAAPKLAGAKGVKKGKAPAKKSTGNGKRGRKPKVTVVAE